MSVHITWHVNRASEAEIAEHLQVCDADFVPPLSGRVIIKDYARKIIAGATRFEAWSGTTMIGLVAAYCNDRETRTAYVTSVSVLKAWMGQGIAATLMKQCIEHATSSGMRQIALEVAGSNARAIKVYEKSGLIADDLNAPSITMKLGLGNRGTA